jgi:Zn finger protein HypA/HybF involved in hydrogenase expression
MLTEVSMDCSNIDCNELYEGEAEDYHGTFWFTCPKCGADNERVYDING